jgi:hypothetical protein
MDATRFERIAKLFAARREAAAARDATPGAAAAARKRTYLFLQSFESGSITQEAGNPDTYTLTLAHGLGQTVYFSDRPDRVVGAGPTAQFLQGLGFSPANPPNAALVVETGAGDTDVAVLELYSPAYDAASRTATYEVRPLAAWERELGVRFTEAPTDLATLAPAFGAAQLFIDDCADAPVVCNGSGGEYVGEFPVQGYCYNFPECHPCVPYYHDRPLQDTWDYWNNQCNQQFPACNGECNAGAY